MLHVVMGSRGAYVCGWISSLGVRYRCCYALPLDTGNMVKILNIKKI